jgi:hypothetical protein
MKTMKKIFLAMVMLVTSISFAQISTTISAPNVASVNDSIVLVNQNKKATHLTVFQLGARIKGIPVHNNSGGTLFGGKAVYPLGTSTLGVTNIGYAIANSHETIENQVGLLDGDVLDGENGTVTISGILETDTSTYSEGFVYISPTVAGDLTNVEPEFPNYAILMGTVTDVGVTGKIAVDIRDDVNDVFIGFWNGVITQTFIFNATSDGATITGSLIPANGHPDLTMRFSDGLTTLDTSPAATITLTAGTDSNPQLNYVYIPQSTKVLTLSTAGFPVAQHIKIASLFLRSATSTQTDGALRNQNFNDHIEDTSTFQGHLSHITSRLRTLDAKWESGVAGTTTINTGPTPDDVFVATTGGIVRQLHLQSFPALDTETGDDIHVVNNLANPYVTITNLNTQILDSQGNTLNNTSFSFVMWGVINSDGEQSHIMLNLPSDSYAFANPQAAIDDSNGFSDYTISKAFEGVGFLIARFTYTFKNNAWVLIDTHDLRNTVPNNTAGGGIGGAGVTEFTQLTDTPSSYTGDAGKIYQVAAGELALEATDSPTFADLFVTNNIVTGVATNSNLPLEINGGAAVFTGFSNRAAASGVGLEIGNDGSKSIIQSFNRTLSSLMPINYLASSHNFSGGDATFPSDIIANGGTVTSTGFKTSLGTASQLFTANGGIISTNTAFNKNFGTTAGTVKEGNAGASSITGGQLVDLDIFPTLANNELRYDRYNNGIPNAPASSTDGNGVMTVGKSGVDNKAQLAFANNSISLRNLESAVWGSWLDIYNSGNSNGPSFDWSANNITALGNITANGGNQVWDASNLNRSDTDFATKALSVTGDLTQEAGSIIGNQFGNLTFQTRANADNEGFSFRDAVGTEVVFINRLGNLTANGGSQVWDASNLNGAAFDFEAKTITANGSISVNSGTINTAAVFESTDEGTTVKIMDDTGDGGLEYKGNTLFFDSDKDNLVPNSEMKWRIDGSIKMTLDVDGRVLIQNLNLTTLPVFADDTAAASLNQGDVYRTSTGELRIKL